MGGLGLALGIALMLGGLAKKKPGKKNGKRLEELPPGGCGLYPWLPDDVDNIAVDLIDEGATDIEQISVEVARSVYPMQPEGQNQIWPPQAWDSRAHCILDRIKIRVNLLLAEILDEQAGGDDECPEGERFDVDTQTCVPIVPGIPAITLDEGAPSIPAITTCPAGTSWDPDARECVEDLRGPDEALVCPPGTRPDPEAGECYPDYPPPTAWDPSRYEHPENYPSPNTFHQVGGPHSADDLGTIARMALAQFGATIQEDPQWALDQANKSALWKAYRAILNCVPTNHAYFASKNEPGTKYYYPTPHGYHINLFPRHDDVRAAMLEGRAPERYAHPDDPLAEGRPGNPHHHAWIWLPPLDPKAYLEGEIVVLREYWDTGDWKLMPPPEFMTWAINEGIPGLPQDLAWTTLGCEEYWEWEAA